MYFRMKNKLRLSVALMIITILVITAFQLYWLRKTYLEEGRNLTIQTNIFFRESVYELQAFKLKLDSNVRFRHTIDGNMSSMISIVRSKIEDSARKTPGTAFFVEMDTRVRDTPTQMEPAKRTFMRRSAPGDLFDVLIGVDSLQDSLKVAEIQAAYQRILKQQNISIPFSITRSVTRVRRPPGPPDPESNKITVGITKPITYTLELQGKHLYLLNKIKSQIIVSIFLIAVTTLSFLFLFRNLQRQRRLTQMKNDFISNITHELKTPIATVNVAIEALRDFGGVEDPVRTKEYLDISAAELQRLSLLVDKVLKLSMFESKAINLKKEYFDLKELVEEVLRIMRLQFDKNKASVSLETNGDNFTIHADRLHITSVLFNLLDNALKYSRENPVIKLELISHAEHVELKVSDNGIGIAKEYRGKVFDKFFRVPTGDKHNIKGYGLGLSYVSEVVKSHIGFIYVESELEKGSTFFVNLPFKEASVINYGGGRKAFREVFRL